MRTSDTTYVLILTCCGSNAKRCVDVSRRRKNQKKKYFGYKVSSPKITTENAFGRLKARLRCLHRAMDIDTNALPQLFYASFYISIAT